MGVHWMDYLFMIYNNIHLANFEFWSSSDQKRSDGDQHISNYKLMRWFETNHNRHTPRLLLLTRFPHISLQLTSRLYGSHTYTAYFVPVIFGINDLWYSISTCLTHTHTHTQRQTYVAFQPYINNLTPFSLWLSLITMSAKWN